MIATDRRKYRRTAPRYPCSMKPQTMGQVWEKGGELP